MLETLEKRISKNFDSCVVELPKEFALANGFPEKCFVSLTLRNGKLESEIIEYNDQDEKEVEGFIRNFHPSQKAKESTERFVNKYSDFIKEMENIDG